MGAIGNSNLRLPLGYRITQLAAVLFVIMFMLIYWYQPLLGGWNDPFYNAANLIAALLAAIFWDFGLAGIQTRRTASPGLGIFRPGAGLYLSRLFGRGLWGRSWWGLVAFALSDGISFWYDMGGSLMISESAGNILSLITYTLYFSAYVLLALACLGQLLLLRQATRPVVVDPNSRPNQPATAP
jgi:hypothetical protein